MLIVPAMAITYKKLKRSKSAAAERWKTGAEDYIFNLGENEELFFTSGREERIPPSVKQPITPRHVPILGE